MSEIDTDKIYKQLKKQNGEGVARVMRSAVLLDVPNIVHILEFAGNNPDDAQKLVPVIREIYKTQQESQYHTDKNPLELLNDAGYDAFVVKTEKQKNSIKKYFRPGEELCTFKDPHRHENYYMIHAVKRGAENIKPATKPEREDEYGTSVISIQIAKTGGFISIKNRYNHTVNDPDATFNSNPDNIILGLSNSLKKFFHVDFNTSENPLPHNFRIVNDQMVRYNYEIDTVYFGSDYYFSGNEITKLNKDYEVMLDYYILDKRSGTVRGILEDDDECTCDVFNHVFQNKKILVKRDKEYSQIFADDVHIATVCDGKIIELNLPGIDVVGDKFLYYNESLTNIKLPDATKIGSRFLVGNQFLTSIELPNATKIGSDFLPYNQFLTSIKLPNATKIGDDFLYFNKVLISIELPNATKIGSYFLFGNKVLTSIEIPKAIEIGDDFLRDNKSLTSIKLPNVTKIGNYFLFDNCYLTSIKLPNATKIGDGFLYYNEALKSIELPKATEIGDDFLSNNKVLTSIELPNATKIGSDFLRRNKSLTSIELPKATKIGDGFLRDNKSLINMNIPKISPIKRLKFVVGKNKIQQKGLESMLVKLLEKSLKTNNQVDDLF